LRRPLEIMGTEALIIPLCAPTTILFVTPILTRKTDDSFVMTSLPFRHFFEGVKVTCS